MKRFYLSTSTHGHLLTLDVFEHPSTGNWSEYLYKDFPDIIGEDNKDCYQKATDWRDEIIVAVSVVSNILPQTFLYYNKPFDPNKKKSN